MTNPNLESQTDSRCPCFALPASECHCAKIPVENVVCPRCFQLHVDVDKWALKPHKTHLCEHCGNLFEGTCKAVSYPSFTSGFPENVEFVCTPLPPQKSDYEQMLDAIQAANSWLQHAYKLMESQGISEETVDSEWPLHLGDAVHYCGDALSELDPE